MSCWLLDNLSTSIYRKYLIEQVTLNCEATRLAKPTFPGRGRSTAAAPSSSTIWSSTTSSTTRRRVTWPRSPSKTSGPTCCTSPRLWRRTGWASRRPRGRSHFTPRARLPKENRRPSRLLQIILAPFASLGRYRPWIMQTTYHRHHAHVILAPLGIPSARADLVLFSGVQASQLVTAVPLQKNHQLQAAIGNILNTHSSMAMFLSWSFSDLWYWPVENLHQVRRYRTSI